MASVIYNNARYLLATDSLNFINDDINIILTSGYLPDIDNDLYLSAVANYEISGTGYTSAGIPLSNKELIVDNVNDRIILSADNLSWTSSYLSATGAVLYKEILGSTSATSANTDYTISPLISFVDFGNTYITSGNNFNINWSIYDGVLLI
jgi:hypothetical protein